MSYAGRIVRGRRAAGEQSQEGAPRPRAASGGAMPPGGERGARPLRAATPRAVPATGVGQPDTTEMETDWERVAVFAAGTLIGILLGAGGALLLAPQSGRETRRAIVRRGRRLGVRSRDAWDDLRDELRFAARRGSRRVGRAARSRRWAAEDVLDRGRRVLE